MKTSSPSAPSGCRDPASDFTSRTLSVLWATGSHPVFEVVCFPHFSRVPSPLPILHLPQDCSHQSPLITGARRQLLCSSLFWIALSFVINAGFSLMYAVPLFSFWISPWCLCVHARQNKTESGANTGSHSLLLPHRQIWHVDKNSSCRRSRCRCFTCTGERVRDLSLASPVKFWNAESIPFPSPANTQLVQLELMGDLVVDWTKLKVTNQLGVSLALAGWLDDCSPLSYQTTSPAFHSEWYRLNLLLS